jgi:hypothetical protein
MPRHGGNVHSTLGGILKYYPYSALEAPSEGLSDATPVVLYARMFPIELLNVFLETMVSILQQVAGDICAVESASACSESSGLVRVRTSRVWDVIHRARYRVLMDRHGFWYAESMDQYLQLKQYCENLRSMPQQERHFVTDGLPCMPLVLELSRNISRGDVNAPEAPPAFDEVVPFRGRKRP